MRYLVDTCVISETVRKRPEPQVLDWLASVNEIDLFLSVLTVGELHKGVSRVADEARRAVLANWLQGPLQERFGDRLIPIDSLVAAAWGELQGVAQRSGRGLPVIDSLIAATALVHGLCVATRNVGDFAPTGVAVFDPFAVR